MIACASHRLDIVGQPSARHLASSAFRVTLPLRTSDLVAGWSYQAHKDTMWRTGALHYARLTARACSPEGADAAALGLRNVAADLQPAVGRRRGSLRAVGKRRPTPTHRPTPNRSAADRSERNLPFSPRRRERPLGPPPSARCRRVQPTPPRHRRGAAATRRCRRTR